MLQASTVSEKFANFSNDLESAHKQKVEEKSKLDICMPILNNRYILNCKVLQKRRIGARLCSAAPSLSNHPRF